MVSLDNISKIDIIGTPYGQIPNDGNLKARVAYGPDTEFILNNTVADYLSLTVNFGDDQFLFLPSAVPNWILSDVVLGLERKLTIYNSNGLIVMDKDIKNNCLIRFIDDINVNKIALTVTDDGVQIARLDNLVGNRIVFN